MPIVTVTAAIAGLKSTLDLAKAALAARDELKLAEMQQSINDRVIDVQNAALALQEKQSAARDEIERLSDELRTMKAALNKAEESQAERSKYELNQLCKEGFAYKSKADAADPEHFICQPCFDGPDKRKAVLRYTAATKVGVYSTPASWTCPCCNNRLSD